MFLRVLSAMVAADAIDRHRRAQQQRRLVDELSHHVAQAPALHGTDSRERNLGGAAAEWDLRAPERPS
jgi:hypothetical protein